MREVGRGREGEKYERAGDVEVRYGAGSKM